ncbi:MAG: hypothetical protein ACJ8IR_09530 [Alphaproteobacteria bacterium]
MTGLALMLVTLAGVPNDSRRSAATHLLSAVKRYFLSALGPVSISAAHFGAALIFLHSLPRAEFGLFSFLLIVVPFCISLSGATFTPPIARQNAAPGGITEAERLTLFKTNLLFSALAALAVSLVICISGGAAPVAALLGAYGGLMSLRWFARCWSYGQARNAPVAISDVAYSVFLCGSLFVLVAVHRLNGWTTALALFSSAACGLLTLELRNLPQYVRALRIGQLGPFLDIWRDMSGWAVLGVLLSELTVNAHAYLVTFISGPHAFAVLAVGSLLMRPVSLVLTAVPDMERPLMSWALRAGDQAWAFRIVKEFRTAASAIWLATILLAAALLTWFPQLIVKKDYAFRDVVFVLAISASVMALRAMRTPDSVLLQAAGEFRRLAGAGAWASVVSITSALVLLLLAGPIAAPCGILMGELVATQRIFALTRAWKRDNA